MRIFLIAALVIVGWGHSSAQQSIVPVDSTTGKITFGHVIEFEHPKINSKEFLYYQTKRWLMMDLGETAQVQIDEPSKGLVSFMSGFVIKELSILVYYTCYMGLSDGKCVMLITDFETKELGPCEIFLKEPSSKTSNAFLTAIQLNALELILSLGKRMKS